MVTAWNPNANGSVEALAVSGTAVCAGGVFTSVGLYPQSRLAGFDFPSSASVPTDPPDAGFALTRILPNPAWAAAHIEYTLSAPARVRIRMYDLEGRLVSTVLDELRPAGRQEALWSRRQAVGGLHPGLYFVRLDTGGRSFTKSLVLIPR
jgi:hypothetical protein